MKKTIGFFIAIIFLFFAVVSVTGCNYFRKISEDIHSRKIAANFDYGTWTGSTYTNKFFGFSITVPEDWYINEKEEVKAYVQTAREADYVDKDVMKKMSSVDDITNACLFYVTQYTEEETIDKGCSNPAFMLTALNHSGVSQEMIRAQYLDIFREQCKKAMPSTVFHPETTKTIGSVEFTSLESEMDNQGITVYREHLICLKNNFILQFVIAWLEPSEKEQLDKIMSTLTWDK
ncbi:MAG: hypothetical protein FWE67_04510 [Planctomycetaceae bacterium]|nr:hypothetical protein [Planctomycetaceae bacterium]